MKLYQNLLRHESKIVAQFISKDSTCCGHICEIIDVTFKVQFFLNLS